MKNTISKIWFLFDRNEKVQLVLIFIAILIGSFIEAIGIGAVVPFIGILVKPEYIYNNVYLNSIYNIFEFNSTQEFIIFMGIVLMAVYILKNFYLFLLTVFQAYFTNSNYQKLATNLFRLYLYSPYIFHLDKNTAQLLRNLGIIQSVINGIVMPILLLASDFTILTFVTVLLLINDPISTIIMLGCLGGAIGFFFLIIKTKLNKYGEIYKYHSGKLNQEVMQGLGSIKETLIRGNQGFFHNNYKKHFSQFIRSLRFQQIATQSPRYYIETIVMILIVVLLGIYVKKGVEPQKIVVTLSLFAVAAVRLIPSLNRISGSITKIRFYIPGLNEVYGDIVQCSELSLLKTNVKPIEILKIQRQIEVSEVEYQYGISAELAINKVTFNIPRNATVGFVGASGAGKTTIIDIVLGLLTPQKGEILVDGVDIQKNLFSWQKQIGYIPQQIYLMDSSIRLNVAFGIPESEIDEEQVWHSLKLAQLDEVVHSLPNKLDTVIGEHGARLSGGQRQRIGIARALYHDPEVLVMDEATAALDNNTEREFMQALHNLSGEKTILIIAHRLTTVKDCDKIIFFKEGKIEDEGTYDELIVKNSDFKNMAGK